MQVAGEELPSNGGVTLLHVDCFQTPCDFVLRGRVDDKTVTKKKTMTDKFMFNNSVISYD